MAPNFYSVDRFLRHASQSVLIANAYLLMLCGSAAASDTFCQPSEAEVFCSFRSETTLLTQADVDTSSSQLTSAAWVIGGNTSISLPAGQTYTPGNAIATGAPTIWVIDGGVLEIDGHGANAVGLAAHIYLCDNATFRVRDATFRSEQDFAYQYWLWAAGNSRVEYENATIATSKSGVNGTSFQIMRSNAQLTAPGGGPADFAVIDGSLDLVSTDSTSISLDGVSGLVSLYGAGSGTLELANSSYAEISTTTCAGDSHSLVGVPVACDLAGGDCFGPSHPLTDFDRIDSPTIDVDQSRVFAWTVETFPSSTTQLDTIPTEANLSVLVAGDLGSQTLTLNPGAAPVGLSDRVLSLNNAHVSFWSVLPSEGSQVTLASGSEVANVEPAENSLVIAEGALLRNGRVRVSAGSEVRLFNSVVDEDLLNLGVLQAVESSIQQVVILDGPTWLADSTLTQTPSISSGGVLYEVSLTQPASGIFTPGDSIEIHGSVELTDPFGLATPYPPAVVELYDPILDTTTVLATLTSDTPTQILASLDTTGLASGNYEIRLRYTNTTEAIAVRSVSLGAAVPSLGWPALAFLGLLLSSACIRAISVRPAR